MKTRNSFVCLVMTLIWAGATLAAGPVASPDLMLKETTHRLPSLADKAFGDPTDLKAAAIAAADYVRYMQADITEDNAGNGASDTDPDDAGWDWSLSAFEHSASASATNIYGATAAGLLAVYTFNPDPLLMTAMQDAADHMVAAGPTVIRSAYDFVFLLDFAALPGVANPLTYQQAAADIWDYRLANYTTSLTATEFAEWLRDVRGVTQNYPNGIIAWDLSPWAAGLMKLDAAFPAPAMYATYAAQAAEIAEVLYQDSIALAPGLFDVHGRNKDYDPTWANKDYWWYTLGVSGLIEAFAATGTHTAEIPALETILLECQYSDGAFSYQYGAHTDINDTDWQSTAYAAIGINKYLGAAPANLDALYNAGVWLAGTQDVSGGFVYSSGNHYPEIGGECAAGLAAAYTASAITITASASPLSLPDPSPCGNTGDVSFFYDRNDATPGLFGYELVIAISGGLAPIATTDFSQVAPMDFFRVDDNLDGTFTVNATRYGADPGLLTSGKLFSITVTTDSEGPVTFDIVSYRLRDPQNAPLFADLAGTGFLVDCTAPAAVTGITADPRHNKVDVAWTHDGQDTIAFEVYRGLWYDTTPDNSAYPEYDDLAGSTIPTRPVDYADVTSSPEWEFAGSVSPQSVTSFTDIGAVQGGASAFDPAGADRGVYYYEVFAVDAAGNRSAIAPANDRATNYWLGDVCTTYGDIIPDGLVGVPDIDRLGSAFATSDGDGDYLDYVDVGPTDDWSAKGIPTTDSLIDFEDLMIFALNYSVVGPAKTAVPVSAVVDLAWTRRDDGRWALVLVNGNGLQGVHVRADVPVGSVEAGDLVTSQSELPFLVNAGSKLDVNLALMGRGVSFAGSGELFSVDSPADIKASDLSIDLRGVDNSRLEFSLDKISQSDTPLVFKLSANYPNPFNPMTKISFSLPTAQDVTLAVYSLDGRRVATLLNETRGPGQHDVVWMGRDDAGHAAASGTYFYRLDAGPYSQVRKMTLMK